MNGGMVMIINVIAILLTLFTWFVNSRRISIVQDLALTIISKKNKSDSIDQMNSNTKFLKITLALSVLNLVLRASLIKFLVPAIAIVFASNVLLSLFDEVDTFTNEKGTAAVVTEFNKRQKDEAKMKASIREKQNREKRISELNKDV